MHLVQMGLGLLSIGRQWGINSVQPPAEDAALALLETAYSCGVRFFDTAPSYARSEAILGHALSSGFIERDKATIATKMGEHWDATERVAHADHRFDRLLQSLDRSMELLGHIDLLQLHKANTTNIASVDVLKALDRAAQMGITAFGASVTDLETAAIACETGRYQYIQFPFNVSNRSLEPIFGMLAKNKMKAIVNRPFAMGALIQNGNAEKSEGIFRFINERSFSGVVLSGTSSISHLQDNIAAFQRSII